MSVTQMTKMYSESYIVLDKLNLIDSIPTEIYNIIKENYDNNINFTYIDNFPLEYQPLSKETRKFLTYLYIKYICKSENEINQYKREIVNNTKK